MVFTCNLWKDRRMLVKTPTSCCWFTENFFFQKLETFFSSDVRETHNRCFTFFTSNSTPMNIDVEKVRKVLTTALPTMTFSRNFFLHSWNFSQNSSLPSVHSPTLPPFHFILRIFPSFTHFTPRFVVYLTKFYDEKRTWKQCRVLGRLFFYPNIRLAEIQFSPESRKLSKALNTFSTLVWLCLLHFRSSCELVSKGTKFVKLFSV